MSKDEYTPEMQLKDRYDLVRRLLGMAAKLIDDDSQNKPSTSHSYCLECGHRTIDHGKTYCMGSHDCECKEYI